MKRYTCGLVDKHQHFRWTCYLNLRCVRGSVTYQKKQLWHFSSMRTSYLTERYATNSAQVTLCCELQQIHWKVWYLTAIEEAGVPCNMFCTSAYCDVITNIDKITMNLKNLWVMKLFNYHALESLVQVQASSELRKTHSLCLWPISPYLNNCIWMASKRNRTIGSFHSQVTTYLVIHTRKLKKKKKKKKKQRCIFSST